jgi:hypothetical protein
MDNTPNDICLVFYLEFIFERTLCPNLTPQLTFIKLYAKYDKFEEYPVLKGISMLNARLET